MIDFKKLVAALQKLGDGSNFDRPVKASDMTLRDYFAARALQGSARDFKNKALAAHWAYEMADAMLGARK